MRRSALPLAIGLLLLGAGTSLATQCDITVTPVNFGFYDPLSPVPLDTTGTINVTCQTPAQLPQTVALQLTAGSSGSFAQRSMTPASGGPYRLYYNLYSAPSMSTVIGDGSGGSSTLTNTVHRTAPWNITLYGRMPQQQQVPAGVFTDTLTATILW